MLVARWLGRAHRPRTEIVLAAGLYLVYEAGRASVADSVDLARHDARLVIDAEKSIHLFWERGIQDAVPDLAMEVLSAAYMTFHLAITVLLLIWLYRRHCAWFPLARTALIGATALALVVHITFPTAPPRLIGLTEDAVTDTANINLNSRVLGVFYNPIAAMPSMHFGYALLIGVLVFKLARSRLVRLVGLAYPPLVLFVIVATGNHFILDAAAGGAVMVTGWLWAAAVVCPRAHASLVREPSGERARRPRTARAY
jgi:hypothetical protein